MKGNIFLRAFKQFDLFGKSLTFEERENEKYTTIIGNVATYLIIIASIIFGVILGSEIVLKEKPMVINSIERINYSRITLDDYPVIFSFSFADGSEVEDIDELFDYSTLMYTISGYNFTITNEISYGFKDCKPEDFKPLFRSTIVEYLARANQRIYCLTGNNLHFQDRYVDLNSTFLASRFHTCGAFIPNKVCNYERAEKVLKSFYITLVTYDAFLEPNKYNNHVTYLSNAYSTLVTTDYSQRVFITTEIGSVETNYGFIFDVYDTQYYYQRKSLSKDLMVHTQMFYNVTFDSTQLRSKMFRSYTKIQDILAKIGGFFNALWIILYVILRNYFEFSYYDNIYSYIKENDSDVMIKKINNIQINNNNNNKSINDSSKLKIIDLIDINMNDIKNNNIDLKRKIKLNDNINLHRYLNSKLAENNNINSLRNLNSNNYSKKIQNMNEFNKMKYSFNIDEYYNNDRDNNNRRNEISNSDNNISLSNFKNKIEFVRNNYKDENKQIGINSKGSINKESLENKENNNSNKLIINEKRNDDLVSLRLNNIISNDYGNNENRKSYSKSKTYKTILQQKYNLNNIYNEVDVNNDNINNTSNFQVTGSEEATPNYFIYLFYKIFYCYKSKTYRETIPTIRKILSFNNIIGLSYEYFNSNHFDLNEYTSINS